MSQINRNKNLSSTLKTKLLNILMSHGKKNTSEKILFNSIKKIHKAQHFHLKSILKLAFLNSIPVFKLNEQVIKKGKRKVKKKIPFFLVGDSNRIIHGLKVIKETSHKLRQSDSFYKSLSSELINLVKEKSSSMAINREIKNQVSQNKRYVSRFRW